MTWKTNYVIASRSDHPTKHTPNKSRVDYLCISPCRMWTAIPLCTVKKKHLRNKCAEFDIFISFYSTKKIILQPSLQAKTWLHMNKLIFFPTSINLDWLRTDVGWKWTFFSLLLESREVSWLTLTRFGYMPATRAAFTTAQFSEFRLTSRISLPPRARTKPEEGTVCFKFWYIFTYSSEKKPLSFHQLLSRRISAKMDFDICIFIL